MWRKWLKQHASGPSEEHPSADIAMAVLLLECARADSEQDEAETAQIRTALESQLNISPAEVERIMGAAGRSSEQAVSLYGPVSQLNDTMSAEQKRELVQWMWRVAHADGKVDPYEEHLLRQVADLLYVPHSEFVKAKLQASGDR